jgi:ribose 5-phosphate isomerase B
MKTLYIASDHAGFKLKTYLLKNYPSKSWVDLGPSTDARVDYPDFANLVAEKVCNESDSMGVLICGSGQGMAMRANKFPRIRAALCYSEESTQLTRQHNDANIICMGERLISPELALKLLDIFIKTPFEGGRHADRVKKIGDNIQC